MRHHPRDLAACQDAGSERVRLHSTFALIAAVFALGMSGDAWARRKNLKKIDQVGRAAAHLPIPATAQPAEAMIETKAGVSAIVLSCST